MTILLDSNILLRTTEPLHPLHKSAVDAAELLRTNGQALCLVPQVLYEFWVVATRPIGVNGLGLTIATAQAELWQFKTLFDILDDVPPILPVWEHWVLKHQVAGKTAQDARLVAAMIVHGIGSILTVNAADFKRYPEIAALAPGDLVQSSPAPTTTP